MTDNIFPVDEFLADKGYPGFKPEFLEAPSAVESFRAFSKDDEERFWFLDFHSPRGFTPMGYLWATDCFCWGTQTAAEQMPLPGGRGLAARMAGTFLFASTIPVTSESEIENRHGRVSQTLPDFLTNFVEIWNTRVEELNQGLEYLESYETAGRSLAELRQFLVDARRFHRRAWEIHFEIMYPLLANYLGFYGVCQEFGIDTGEISKFLQGHDNRIIECDRELWGLTQNVRQQKIEEIFRNNDAANIDVAMRADSGAKAWSADFDKFLGHYGRRTEGVYDISLPSWIEDPTPPLGMIKTFLDKEADHDFGSAHRRVVEERDSAVNSARSKLTVEEQQVFDAALDSCEKANFAWWNEEHNYYIDLRATIPLRKACLAIGEAVGADKPADTIFLFWPELMALLEDRKRWQEYRSLVSERQDYYQYWSEKRATVPKVLGTIPEEADDPILLEIFGLNQNFFAALRKSGQNVTELSGVPASSGTVRGRARVLHDASQLHAIKPGEILVCEGTTPSWTPAFAKIAACVCDGGGTLTHASIISREYRIPCVVGVGTATTTIKNDDEIEVDGTNGRVRILGRELAA